MAGRDKIMETIDNDAYSWSCRCPRCRKLLSRDEGEGTMFCSKCGQKLHFRAFTKEELDSARFERQQDEYED